MRAVENRVVVIVAIAIARAFEDAIGDAVRLVPLVHGFVYVDGFAAFDVRPKRFFLAGTVVGDDDVRSVEDDLRRAVVLLKPDDGGAGEILLKL